MTDLWSIDLGELEFRRRFEEGSLVLWRPGLTLWIDIYGYPPRAEAAEHQRKVRQRQDLPPGARVLEAGTDRFGYVFQEVEQGQQRWSLQGWVFGPEDQVMMACYFDREEDVELATRLWKGVCLTL